MKTTFCLFIGVDGDGRPTDKSIFTHFDALSENPGFFAEFDGTAFISPDSIHQNREFCNWMYFKSRQICAVKDTDIICEMVNQSKKYDLGDVTIIGTAELIEKIDIDLMDDIYVIGPAKRNSPPVIPGLGVIFDDLLGKDYILYTMGIDCSLTNENIESAISRFEKSPDNISDKDAEIVKKTLSEIEAAASLIDEKKSTALNFGDSEFDDVDDTIDPINRELLNAVDRANRSLLLLSRDLGQSSNLILQHAHAIKGLQDRVKTTEDAIGDQFERNYQWVCSEFRDSGEKFGELRNQFGVICAEIPDEVNSAVARKFKPIKNGMIIAIILAILALVLSIVI